MAKKKTYLYTTSSEKFPDEYDHYEVTHSKVKNKQGYKSKDDLFKVNWLGGSAGSPYGGSRYEGEVRNYGDGIKLEFGDQELDLNYGDAHTLRLLLELVHEDKIAFNKK